MSSQLFGVIILLNESRPLRVYADSKEISSDYRIRVQGRSNMTLLPDFFLVDIYNVSDFDKVDIRQAKKLSVSGDGGDLLCSGDIEGIYEHEDGTNNIISISVSDGQEFWNSRAETTIGGGAYIKDAIRTILKGADLGVVACEDIRISRGQTFSGRIADIVHTMAVSVRARAYIAKGVLNVVGKEYTSNVAVVSEDDVIMKPQYLEKACILKTKVKGYTVGNVVQYEGIKYRIIVQTINLDNMMGDWNTEMTLVENEEFIREGMEGGW